MSWTEVMDGASIGGTTYAVDAFGDVVVAVGDGGNGDVTGPSALAMISTDGGDSWERYVIDPDAGATAVAIGAEGRISVAGISTISSSRCLRRSRRILEYDGPRGSVLCRRSGGDTNWLCAGCRWRSYVTGRHRVGRASPGDWSARPQLGPHFGLVAATKSSILLGPVPAP
jgi:hypothetical protein